MIYPLNDIVPHGWNRGGFWLFCIVLPVTVRHGLLIAIKTQMGTLLWRSAALRTYNRFGIISCVWFSCKKQACDVANGFFRPGVGQLLFYWDRQETFLLTRDRPFGNKITSAKCQSWVTHVQIQYTIALLSNAQIKGKVSVTPKS